MKVLADFRRQHDGHTPQNTRRAKNAAWDAVVLGDVELRRIAPCSSVWRHAIKEELDGTFTIGI